MLHRPPQEFRIAVCGLSGSGKSALIARICDGFYDNTQKTETEDEKTVLCNESFLNFWDFPDHVLKSDTADSLIVGFSCMLFLCDLSMEEPTEAEVYLKSLMKTQAFMDLPYLIVATKTDLLSDPNHYKPAQLLKFLTHSLQRTQCVPVSSVDGSGIDGVLQWIYANGREIDIFEFS